MNREKARQHDEYIKKVLEENRLIQEKKVEDYYIKQMKLKERQDELNAIKMEEEIKRQEKIRENQEKLIEQKKGMNYCWLKE